MVKTPFYADLLKLEIEAICVLDLNIVWYNDMLDYKLPLKFEFNLKHV